MLKTVCAALAVVTLADAVSIESQNESQTLTEWSNLSTFHIYNSWKCDGRSQGTFKAKQGSTRGTWQKVSGSVRNKAYVAINPRWCMTINLSGNDFTLSTATKPYNHLNSQYWG